MNSPMPPRIESRFATVTAAAALIAISALVAPAQTFAAPTPLNTSGCSIGPAKAFCQAHYTTSPTTDAEVCDWPSIRRHDYSRYEDECEEYSSDIPW